MYPVADVAHFRKLHGVFVDEVECAATKAKGFEHQGVALHDRETGEAAGRFNTHQVPGPGAGGACRCGGLGDSAGGSASIARVMRAALTLLNDILTIPQHGALHQLHGQRQDYRGPCRTVGPSGTHRGSSRRQTIRQRIGRAHH
jgi:hypothetical protein